MSADAQHATQCTVHEIKGVVTEIHEDARLAPPVRNIRCGCGSKKAQTGAPPLSVP